jgi:predicted anti-sigma-YlaC factor YlaD
LSEGFEGEGDISLRRGKTVHYKKCSSCRAKSSTPAVPSPAERWDAAAERCCAVTKNRLLLATLEERYRGKNLCWRSTLLIAFM